MELFEIYSSYHYSIFIEGDKYHKSPKTDAAFDRLKNSYETIKKVNNPCIDTPELISDEFVGLYVPDIIKEIENSKLKNFILELCEIVKYLHSLEIYALDLKPDHIRNNNNKIFLIDWYEKSHGAQWGDPYRLFTNGEPSKSEDIYAIGNLIYFYLTGKHPFSSNNPLQSLYMMRKSKPQLTYTIFDDIIGRCLSKNPRDRYSDINELMKEIKEA
jgi:serine/threonine protein kinase